MSSFSNQAGNLTERKWPMDRKPQIPESRGQESKVEHAIGNDKIFRIVKDECGLRKNNSIDKTFYLAADFITSNF